MEASSNGEPLGGSSSADSEAQKYSKLFVFSGDNKAGMQGMDKERQAKVIYELSKNSAYFKRMTELDAATEVKAASMLQALSQLDAATVRRLEGLAQAKMMECESRRSFERIVVVLDMDMFYAAVEIRDRPSLASLPVAVGGEGMISTSNYIARKFGVRAAMPGFIARKLCPDLVLVHHNFDKYRAVAEVVRNIVKKYDPDFMSHGLDEVYFDVTPYIHKHYPELAVNMESMRAKAYEIVESVRLSILDYTHLTSSAGLANNFSLAKICADINKPNGQYMLPGSREAVLSFLSPLSVRKIGGIGKVFCEKPTI
ncbi:DNA polymerase IV [archaeon]|nr:MAG: DNA polymerase IV [archaeon]